MSKKDEKITELEAKMATTMVGLTALTNQIRLVVAAQGNGSLFDPMTFTGCQIALSICEGVMESIMRKGGENAENGSSNQDITEGA